MLKLEELFGALNNAGVKYLLIGGMASILYGVPRTTIDIDIAIAISSQNVKKTVKALKKMGLTCDTENAGDIISQGGITFSNEQEVDVLTNLPSKEDFKALWKRRNNVKYEGMLINVISKDDQIRLLREVGRNQDLEDAEILSRK